MSGSVNEDKIPRCGRRMTCLVHLLAHSVMSQVFRATTDSIVPSHPRVTQNTLSFQTQLVISLRARRSWSREHSTADDEQAHSCSRGRRISSAVRSSRIQGCELICLKPRGLSVSRAQSPAPDDAAGWRTVLELRIEVLRQLTWTLVDKSPSTFPAMGTSRL